MGKLIVGSMVLALSAMACGPSVSHSRVRAAQVALAQAKVAGAQEHAPFEYVSAQEYLFKARFQQSYSEFRTAIDFAEKSWSFANQARKKAELAIKLGKTGQSASTPARRQPATSRRAVFPTDTSNSSEKPSQVDPSAGGAQPISPVDQQPGPSVP